jgi:hypothetical protein
MVSALVADYRSEQAVLGLVSSVREIIFCLNTKVL